MHHHWIWSDLASTRELLGTQRWYPVHMRGRFRCAIRIPIWTVVWTRIQWAAELPAYDWASLSNRNRIEELPATLRVNDDCFKFFTYSIWFVDISSGFLNWFYFVLYLWVKYHTKTIIEYNTSARNLFCDQFIINTMRLDHTHIL